MASHSNVSLIGMPGCGKSTTGVLLAKKLGYGFIDTDLLIQQMTRQTLQAIIDCQGFLALREFEQRALLSLAPIQQVIATGGSAVYSQAGIDHLKSLGPLVYLQMDLGELERRVGDYRQRGIASDSKQSFADIYHERCPLYERAADIVIDVNNLPHETVVDKLIVAIGNRLK